MKLYQKTSAYLRDILLINKRNTVEKRIVAGWQEYCQNRGHMEY